MGSTYRSRVRPLSEIPSETARTDFAKSLVPLLINVVRYRVLNDSYWVGKSRECYLVAKAVRDIYTSLRHEVIGIIPGCEVSKDDSWPASRMLLADKLVMVFTDYVVNVVVRPGPTPEDRLSSDILTELENTKTELVELLIAVIAEEDRHEGL